jgi:hypothetical protein
MGRNARPISILKSVMKLLKGKMTKIEEVK